MPDVDRDVEGQTAPLELVEVLAHGAPVPAELRGHRAHEEHLLDRAAVELAAERRRRDPAVARHRRRDALAHVRLEQRRPGGQGGDPVDVGMDVDEAGDGDEPLGVDHGPASFAGADPGYSVCLDHDVRRVPGRAGSVHDRRARQRPAAHQAKAASACSTRGRSGTVIASGQMTSSPRASGACGTTIAGSPAASRAASIRASARPPTSNTSRG